MPISYGNSILPASEMKNVLAEQSRQRSGVKTWENLLGLAGQSYAAQTAAATTDYSQAIGEAYAANLRNKDTIAAAGLSKGTSDMLYDLNRDELESAYNTYLSNYGKALDAASENYQKQASAIDTALTGEAENASKIYNAAYEYLKNELANAGMVETVSAPTPQNKLATAKQTTPYLSNKGADWLYDKEGTIRSFSDLLSDMTNADGSLTDRGRQFFDLVFNAMPTGYDVDGTAARSFDQYLSDTDTALRDWYAGADVYNATVRGTHGATLRQLAGIDNTYAYNPQTYLSKEQARQRKADINWLKSTVSPVQKSVQATGAKVLTTLKDLQEADTKTFDTASPALALDISKLSESLNTIKNSINEVSSLESLKSTELAALQDTVRTVTELQTFLSDYTSELGAIKATLGDISRSPNIFRSVSKQRQITDITDVYNTINQKLKDIDTILANIK